MTNVNVNAILSGNASGLVNALQQGTTAGKAFANQMTSAAQTATRSAKEVQDALNRQAQAARQNADAAKAAAAAATQARNTAAAQAVVAADKEAAAHKRAMQAAQQAAEAKVKADATGTQAAQQAAQAQEAAAEQAANAATLASQQKINANMKAAAAADAEAKKIAEALRAEEGATAAAAKAAEYAEASKREARARSLQDLNAYVQSHRQSFQTIGNLAIGAGVVMVAGLAAVAKAYADFDKAMSQVRAATRTTGQEFESLRQAAIKAGADTSFSAEDAAHAITELSKAGVQTRDILKGGLTGALSLAAAGQMDVAEAAETAATAMVVFKLRGQDIPHIADLLAAGAGKAQGSVHDLGEAMKMSALMAANMGIPIEENVATLAAFANAGLLGSDAGTSFKTMLMRLTPQSKEAASEMQRLGFSAYDAQGKFIGMPALAQLMTDKFAGMDQEARNMSMGVLFGADAIRAANILMEQGAEGIKEWTSQVNVAGYAAAEASIKQDNLAGDLEKLSGSINSVFLQAGSGMNDVLRDLVQGFTDVVNWVGTLDPEVLEIGIKFAAAATAGLLVFGALSKMTPGIMAAVTAFKTMRESASPVPDILGKIAKGAAIAGAAMAALTIIGPMVSDKATKSADDYASALLRVSRAGATAKATDLDSVFQGWGKLFGNETVTNVNSMAGAVKELADIDFNEWMNLNFADKLNETFGFTKTNVGQLTDRMKDLGKEMGNMVKNGGAEAAARSFSLLNEEFQRNGKSTRDALNLMPEYEQALKAQTDALGLNLNEQQLLDLALGKLPPGFNDAKAAAEGAASGLGTYTDQTGNAVAMTPELSDALKDVGLSADGAVVSLEKYTEALVNAGLIHMDARTAYAEFEEVLRGVKDRTDELKQGQAELGPILNQTKTDFDFTTESGQKANAMFQEIGKAGIDSAIAFAKNGESQQVVQDQLTKTYDQMVLAAKGMGLTDEQARILTANVLKIPPGVNIQSWMADSAKKMAEETAKSIGAIPPATNPTVTLTVYGMDQIAAAQQALDNLRANSMITANAYASGAKYQWMGGPVRRATGGPIPMRAFADGGFNGPVTGPGTSTSDSIITALSAGEYVIQAKSVQKYGMSMMAAINGGNWEGAQNPMQAAVAAAGVEDSVKHITGLFDDFTRDSDKIFEGFHDTTKNDFQLWGEELAGTTTETWRDMHDTAADNANRIRNDAFTPMQQGSIATGNQVRDTGAQIGAALGAIRQDSSNTAGWVQANAYAPMQAGANATGVAFAQAAGQVEAAFVRMQNAGKEPVRFIIETVYTNGIKAMWDKTASFLGMDALPSVAVPAFHDGGIMSGYTPGVDDRTIAVGGGEAIMRPEWTKAVGPAYINKMNALARANDREGIKAATGNTSGAFAEGGIFDPAPARESLSQIPYGAGLWAQGLTNLMGKMIDGLTTKAQAAAAAMAAAANAAGTWTGGPSGLGNPLPGSIITQWFSAAHNGLDMAAPQGTRIGAAGPGVVSFSGWSAYGGGNEVHVDHPNGLQTWYAHLASPGIGAGSTVQGGSYLGPVGSTGNSTGPHLHFMVLNGGWPNVMNPAPFIGLANGGIVPTFDQGGTFAPGYNIINNATGADEHVRPINREFAEQLAEAIAAALSRARLKIEGIDHITGEVVARIITETTRRAGIK